MPPTFVRPHSVANDLPLYNASIRGKQQLARSGSFERKTRQRLQMQQMQNTGSSRMRTSGRSSQEDTSTNQLLKNILRVSIGENTQQMAMLMPSGSSGNGTGAAQTGGSNSAGNSPFNLSRPSLDPFTLGQLEYEPLDVSDSEESSDHLTSSMDEKMQQHAQQQQHQQPARDGRSIADRKLRDMLALSAAKLNESYILDEDLRRSVDSSSTGAGAADSSSLSSSLDSSAIMSQQHRPSSNDNEFDRYNGRPLSREQIELMNAIDPEYRDSLSPLILADEKDKTFRDFLSSKKAKKLQQGMPAWKYFLMYPHEKRNMSPDEFAEWKNQALRKYGKEPQQDATGASSAQAASESVPAPVLIPTAQQQQEQVAAVVDDHTDMVLTVQEPTPREHTPAAPSSQPPVPVRSQSPLRHYIEALEHQTTLKKQISANGRVSPSFADPTLSVLLKQNSSGSSSRSSSSQSSRCNTPVPPSPPSSQPPPQQLQQQFSQFKTWKTRREKVVAYTVITWRIAIWIARAKRAAASYSAIRESVLVLAELHGIVTQLTRQALRKKPLPRKEKQGNLSMYTNANIRKRLKLKDSPAIRNKVLQWWRAVKRDRRGLVHRNTYISLASAIFLTMIPGRTYEAAARVAEEDWLHDAGAGKNVQYMDFEHFHAALFDLVDLWCETTATEEYLSFLDGLFEQVFLSNMRLPKAAKLHIDQRFLDARDRLLKQIHKAEGKKKKLSQGQISLKSLNSQQLQSLGVKKKQAGGSSGKKKKQKNSTAQTSPRMTISAVVTRRNSISHSALGKQSEDDVLVGDMVSSSSSSGPGTAAGGDSGSSSRNRNIQKRMDSKGREVWSFTMTDPAKFHLLNTAEKDLRIQEILDDPYEALDLLRKVRQLLRQQQKYGLEHALLTRLIQQLESGVAVDLPVHLLHWLRSDQFSPLYAMKLESVIKVQQEMQEKAANAPIRVRPPSAIVRRKSAAAAIQEQEQQLLHDSSSDDDEDLIHHHGDMMSSGYQHKLLSEYEQQAATVRKEEGLAQQVAPGSLTVYELPRPHVAHSWRALARKFVEIFDENAAKARQPQGLLESIQHQQREQLLQQRQRLRQEQSQWQRQIDQKLTEMIPTHRGKMSPLDLQFVRQQRQRAEESQRTYLLLEQLRMNKSNAAGTKLFDDSDDEEQEEFENERRQHKIDTFFDDEEPAVPAPSTTGIRDMRAATAPAGASRASATATATVPAIPLRPTAAVRPATVAAATGISRDEHGLFVREVIAQSTSTTRIKNVWGTERLVKPVRQSWIPPEDGSAEPRFDAPDDYAPPAATVMARPRTTGAKMQRPRKGSVDSQRQQQQQAAVRDKPEFSLQRSSSFSFGRTAGRQTYTLDQVRASRPSTSNGATRHSIALAQNAAMYYNSSNSNQQQRNINSSSAAKRPNG